MAVDEVIEWLIDVAEGLFVVVLGPIIVINGTYIV